MLLKPPDYTLDMVIPVSPRRLSSNLKYNSDTLLRTGGTGCTQHGE